MNYQTTDRKPPKGLDDGAPACMKPKRSADAIITVQTSIEPGYVVPTILPCEPLSAFSARVDAAIPVSGLAKSKRNSAVELGLRKRQTKMEKRMQRIQAEWREAAAKRKEKLAEKEAEKERNGGSGDGVRRIGGINGNARVGKKIKGKGKSKRRKGLAATYGNDDVGDDDPWALIVAKRLENSSTTASGPRSGGLVGLHDVVLAPPKFSKVPKEKNITGNTDIRRTWHVKSPLEKDSTIGLKRQEELGEARRSVVDSYRRMMNERRGMEHKI